MRLKLLFPVKPLHVNQIFGNPAPVYTQVGMKGHNGVDLMALHGQEVRVAHNGVCYIEVDAYQGHGVVIRSNEPFEYGDNGSAYMKSIYWHLKIDGILVKDGQQVEAGDLIGYADNTGLSTGDHLHFGLKPTAYNESPGTWYNLEQNNGYFGCIDPYPYFTGDYAYDIWNLKQQVSLLTKVANLFRKLLGK